MQTKQEITADTVKAKIRTYSRFLRRDFLAILVKMSAKHFNIRTVRCDWRTRTGMVAFLQGVWERLSPLLEDDSIFNWYCTNFDSHETLFSNRKFMLYVYANWVKYGEFFKQQETLNFLKINQNEIEILLNNPKLQEQTHWPQPVGDQMMAIIDDFLKIKAQQNYLSTSAPTPKPMPKSSSMPLMQKNSRLYLAQNQLIQMQPIQPPVQPATTDMLTSNFADIQNHLFIQSDSEDSDISTEVLFDPVNFEIGEYNPESFPLVNQMDYPDSIDLYLL